MVVEKQLLPIHEHPLTLADGGSRCRACCFHTDSDQFYCCYTCNVSFHKECITYSLEITHPYHPIHPLQIWTRKYAEVVKKCFWCNRHMGYAFYRCHICDLNIHLFCASQPQLVLTLDPGKNHDHPLTIFPRRMDFTCNLCGWLDREWFPIYACVQCDIMVHEKCLVLPRVIRISCHEHRISRRHFLTPGEWFCGVCHWQVDPRYGAFFCTKGCGYAVHSKCATSYTVWDGSELEDVPVDEDELKDVEQYEVIDENHIKHFSHDHNLRFILNLNQDGDKRRHCRACNLQIHFDNFYSCDCCDFIIHQECANFKRKKWYLRHRHPLTLKSDVDITFNAGHSGGRGFYCCSICTRFSCGFRYLCEKENCHFEIDVRCAGIPELVNHKSHPQHPLFVNLINTSSLTCVICQKASDFVLYCLHCPNYFMCFKCATLPDKVAYKHDEHPLTLSCGEEEEEGQYWCESCERKLDRKQWFYKCEDCSVTLHIPCLLGSSPYAKPCPIMIKAHRSGEVYTVSHHYPPSGVCRERDFDYVPVRPEEEFDIIPNESLSRPLCSNCDRRCPDSVAFKQKEDLYCSLDCLRSRKLYDDPDIFPMFE